MHEDKLSRAQRVRLEAFAQAAQIRAMTNGRMDLTEHCHIAEAIEEWLWEADAAAAQRTAENRDDYSLRQHCADE